MTIDLSNLDCKSVLEFFLSALLGNQGDMYQQALSPQNLGEECVLLKTMVLCYTAVTAGARSFTGR